MPARLRIRRMGMGVCRLLLSLVARVTDMRRTAQALGVPNQVRM